jgi:hypothetical protein
MTSDKMILCALVLVALFFAFALTLVVLALGSDKVGRRLAAALRQLRRLVGEIAKLVIGLLR